ncbi:MAG: hypothetical protein ETSY2_40575 [Candidatus Entotheonella gemina]|uniref:Uncharacterized protein n=1 Tax=Candidatus Entotheonella gemina TaxID=1429439 RepID=W4LPE1_9BACT|nr:MAG: hypothetical protein ETSY2_40575 [Candidatus Entotheonella gemina]
MPLPLLRNLPHMKCLLSYGLYRQMAGESERKIALFFCASALE